MRKKIKRTDTSGMSEKRRSNVLLEEMHERFDFVTEAVVENTNQIKLLKQEVYSMKDMLVTKVNTGDLRPIVKRVQRIERHLGFSKPTA